MEWSHKNISCSRSFNPTKNKTGFLCGREALIKRCSQMHSNIWFPFQQDRLGRNPCKKMEQQASSPKEIKTTSCTQGSQSWPLLTNRCRLRPLSEVSGLSWLRFIQRGLLCFDTGYRLHFVQCSGSVTEI
jgi:hypothetical protein